jgi:glycosyltransferase involved in cell wall biosynthesis
MSIFIQIASYRDPQLAPTIKNMLENALYPDNLRIGICNQYHPDDVFHINEYKDDFRFRILNVLYSETKGACWARNQIQQMYGGEDYTLQIDSHMRFVKHWDKKLISMLESLRLICDKPLLTCYAPSFDPENDPDSRIQQGWQMAFDRFIPEGTVFFLPETIPNWNQLTGPVRSRFYSAHFCFTLGQFCLEVQHDPNLYFHSEEMSISVRAYTHGYDLFHPHIPIIWHEYTRKGRSKHWDDDREWCEKNKKSHLRNRILFGMEEGTIDFENYGFGKERTLKQYEEYSGIRFSTRSIQQYTLDKKYPPNPSFSTEEELEASFVRMFKHCIDIDYAKVIEKDYDFWVVAFNDSNGETIYRKDADKNEIHQLFNDSYCKVWREFQTTKQPTSWVVWPHSELKGWCDQITGKL